jgi:hypothetical protein
MRLVFETMSARIVDAATITVPLLGKQADAEAIAVDVAMASKIRDALQLFKVAITREGGGKDDL